MQSKRITVMGLGRFGGGIAVARWLVEQGATVLVTDRDPAEKLADSIKSLDGLPIQWQLGGHRTEDFIDTDLIVASPAVPLDNPFLAAARQAGVPITTEIKLFIERCPATIMGVTGTKGKSTTTAMLGAILSSRYRTWVGGNIGRSLLADLPHIDKKDPVVLELSSYMLEHLRPMSWSPHVAVVTMIAPDHLEWHGSFEAYTRAKRTIVQFQRVDDVAILNGNDPGAKELATAGRGKVICFGGAESRPFELTLPGSHNQSNAQAAYSAASVLGISWDEAQESLRHFVGLPHRLQLVHESAGVRYFNDSIATIPEAAIAALNAFAPRTVIQIVGGYDKHLPFTALSAALAERAKAALCIGVTGPAIAELMAQSALPSPAPAYSCGDLPTALRMARQIAVAGDCILLSPGCASYDQFINFEKRGESFAKLAKEF
ncbi:MAG: UDP-N-acetylmuramoyl-L-alanine--D-glutamate ligase [Phycisphaerales bacterium]|nr:UDP-N-acetylmuramoyl-L-alanine--D-glutamate ligase [Phycisphaerales bacterium]